MRTALTGISPIESKCATNFSSQHEHERPGANNVVAQGCSEAKVLTVVETEFMGYKGSQVVNDGKCCF